MKTLFRGMIFLAVATCAMGCTSSYMTDRWRDATDVFTLTVGDGIGAKARVGPVQCGLGTWADNWGLRNGEFSTQDPDYFTMDVVLVELFERCTWGRERNKDYEAEGLLFFSIPDGALESSSLPYYSQFEIAVGLWKSCRLGFNPGELVDFILGWTTIDIYGDDSTRKKRRKKVGQGTGE